MSICLNKYFIYLHFKVSNNDKCLVNINPINNYQNEKHCILINPHYPCIKRM